MERNEFRKGLQPVDIEMCQDGAIKYLDIKLVSGWGFTSLSKNKDVAKYVTEAFQGSVECLKWEHSDIGDTILMPLRIIRRQVNLNFVSKEKLDTIMFALQMEPEMLQSGEYSLLILAGNEYAQEDIDEMLDYIDSLHGRQVDVTELFSLLSPFISRFSDDYLKTVYGIATNKYIMLLEKCREENTVIDQIEKLAKDMKLRLENSEISDSEIMHRIKLVNVENLWKPEYDGRLH